MKLSKDKAGFTLIEVMIALFIFAILGTIAAMGLHAVLNAKARLSVVQAELREFEFATTMMRHDFLQLIQRPISGTSGEELPPLWIKSTHHIEFTTAGYTNPDAIASRSTLRRVAYIWRQGDLIRVTWNALDRPPHITAMHRVLLHHVKNFYLNYVNDKGQLTEVWASDSPVTAPPAAIIVNVTLPTLGSWQGIFPINGRGYGTP